MGLSVSSHNAQPDEAVVTLVMDGLSTNCSFLKPACKFSYVVDVPEIDLVPGQRINFMIESTTENIKGALISLLLKINL